ncbi:hypothetical protein [Flavobacterium sp. W20_MBD1_R3]
MSFNGNTELRRQTKNRKVTDIETWKSYRHWNGKLERINFHAFQTCRYTP